MLRRRRALLRRRLSAKRLGRIAAGSRPIVAGPWVGGVGMELLYWIPLLNWLTTTGGIERERIVAVSRGGADPWYSEVSGRYVDLLDHYTSDDVRTWREERLRRPDTELHVRIHGHDRRMFEIARELTGEEHVEWLHPVHMHRLFMPHWQGLDTADIIRSHTVQRPLPGDPAAAPELPETFVALKTYFSPSFPANDENRRILGRVIEELAERAPIVLLRSSAETESYDQFVPESDGLVQDVHDLLAPRTNLAVQTRIIRAAKVFVSTYGGFSFLGPYAGTPTVGLYSSTPFDVIDLDQIERVGRGLAGGGTRLFRARHVGHVPAGKREPEAEPAQ